ncbi:MAG TPA: hypothetical protein VHD87_05575, partial [Acidimicrobiales bacterium]|nr:hypothetical protein [Acidimicrobiales bacterium]
ASAGWTGRHAAAALLPRVVGRDHYLTLRYEDVVADPTAAMARVAALVGEDTALAIDGDGAVHLPTAHTPTGDGRFRAQAVTLREDRAWVDSLATRDAAVVNTLTAAGRHRYRYQRVPK